MSKARRCQSNKSGRKLSRRRKGRQKIFQARDRNSDGEITLEEFIGNPDGRNVAALTKRFQQFDADGDGALVIDELKSN